MQTWIDLLAEVFAVKYTYCQPKPSCGVPDCPPPCPMPDPCRCEQTIPCACPPKPCPPRPCPPRPQPCPGYLLPRVIASGRFWQRRCQLCLTVSGLPECAEPPYSLISVTAMEPADATLLPASGCGRLTMHVTVPLLCQVRDRNGCVYTGHGLLETDVCMHLLVGGGECWRSARLVQPCVRLVTPPCARETPTFDACLELLVEAYLVRWEPSSPIGPRPPACPELPLYPDFHSSCM